jgi:DNA-binding NarL/FixJ family response regulator
MATRIVVADDHPLWREALNGLLSEHPGWEVVADGREALELCRRFRPDLALMDVRMPEVNGLEATRTIKRESPGTVVLVLSGYEDPDLMAGALEAGASGYILKTATPQQITDAVQGALDGSTPLDHGLAEGLLSRLLGKPRKGEVSSPPALGRRVPSGSAAAPLSASLTQREVEILRLIAQGHTNRQIARSLLLSVSTVKKHVQHILSKLEVSDRTQAAVKANELGLYIEDRQEG